MDECWWWCPECGSKQLVGTSSKQLVETVSEQLVGTVSEQLVAIGGEQPHDRESIEPESRTA